MCGLECYVEEFSIFSTDKKWAAPIPGSGHCDDVLLSARTCADVLTLKGELGVGSGDGFQAETILLTPEPSSWELVSPPALRLSSAADEWFSNPKLLWRGPPDQDRTHTEQAISGVPKPRLINSLSWESLHKASGK